MNEYLAAAISGVVEGITEFLPISSTGHLIVTSELLRFDTQGAFEIIIQLGAVLSVVWFYRQQLLRQAREVRTNTGTRRFWLGVLLAFLPAALVGFLLGDLISQYLFKPTVVASSLIVGGVVMWLVESRPQRSEAVSVEQVRPMQALTIGVIQLLALVPGVSRSASTIIGGMLTGLSRPAATEFSFYLSMPTLGAASLYSLLKHRDEVATQGWGVVAIGLVVSFIVALLAIGWLLRYISRHDFKGFAVYRVFAGIAILLFFHFRGN
ncbi:undecaprenyl-diphosphate phosphatase [Deinococcus peraridilitoris]|uniref:Undecaprenyl-diphosphatase n=1 Tax=Deinococcus peraridilitoris (strain DSM 19664 / LMG 22246 / CIP 109416 / KR-200) TaxID=937777 RepID=L0A790_DEIPD|nr:undecaprenyl-diphosphate phosphatase [Deinococcus peraridilitoris]AFZ69052.1 undecaprenyl-diphosphatase UppP [Deinococcus peraridilitoris DSM 19664]